MHNPQNLYSLIEDAIAKDINMKILYMAAGLDAISFGAYHADMLFTHDQADAIKQAIKEWREMK